LSFFRRPDEATFEMGEVEAKRAKRSKKGQKYFLPPFASFCPFCFRARRASFNYGIVGSHKRTLSSVGYLLPLA